MSRTVFWRVAGLLVGVQLVTALVAMALLGVFADARSDELVEGTLQLRLDAVAQEVETRAAIGPFGEIDLDPRLRADLGTRFPDPAALLDEAGAVAVAFGAAPDVPPEALRALDAGRVAVDLDARPSWGIAPILAPDGLPAGAVFVSPLDATRDAVRAGPRTAFVRAAVGTAVLAVLLALGLGAAFTARLIGPVRDVTDRVERLGDGDYHARLPVRRPDRPDELGRLALAVNELAARVEASVESLRATDRLRRELVANVGHDLRTPLAALAAHLEEAERLDAEGRSDEAAASLAAARRLSDTSSALVADLFELSVLDAPGDRTVVREPVPLGELVADLAARWAPAAERAGLSFALHAAPGLPTLAADGRRLDRALSNLLGNAVRHTPPGGTVALHAHAEPAGEAGGAHAVLRVADTGEGIAPERLPHVFERYYRGTDARTRSGAGGTGLGLAIARAVAEAHGGTLTAESTLGEGARFTLRLPLGDA